MNRGLIIGFGRAGKRHAKMLDELGIQWWPVDCEADEFVRYNGFESLEQALTYQDEIDYTFAVISTPPDLHLSQIRQCLDAGLPVLCEKPLCSLGQLDKARELLSHPNADKVMVAYNYRYLPALIEARNRPALQWMTCWQDRELPEWGLLLDHVSHDLDILRFLYGDISVKSANYYPPRTFDHDSRRQMWEIVVKVPNASEWETGEMRLRESVGAYADRRAKLEYEDGAELDITADPTMYKAMWQAFLSGQYAPGLGEAIKTQELLEECWRLANE